METPERHSDCGSASLWVGGDVVPMVKWGGGGVTIWIWFMN